MQRDIGAQMILAEWLFVETVADLRHRCQDPEARSRYELLGIAPLLRKLLTDRGEPLLGTIRREERGIVPEFRINQWLPRPNNELDYAVQLGGPELVGDASTPALKVKQFLEARVGRIASEDLTVIQVVRYYANVEGGVHFGLPGDDSEKAMKDMAPILLGRTTGQVEILAHIGQVVVDALAPLCQSILSSPMVMPAMHRLNADGYYDHHWTAEHYRRIADKTRAE